jgi:hypothetical protein
MGFTNKTPNYNLPQWIGTDQPTWLVDVNGAFSAIDTAISDVNVTATGAKNTADSASGLASTAKDAADAATQAATDATTAATAATNAATTATEKAAQAEQTASAAAGTASTAITNANNAVQVANSAEKKANQALAQGIGTWQKKIMTIADIEVITGLTLNTSYYFNNAANYFYNKNLNLMLMNAGIVLTKDFVSLSVRTNFNNDSALTWFPLFKLPFSYDSGKDISLASVPLINYETPTSITGKTIIASSVLNCGIKMYEGSAWIGLITQFGGTGAYNMDKVERITLFNFPLNTVQMGNISLFNWINA